MHYWEEIQDHGRLPLIVDGQIRYPSQSMREKLPRKATRSRVAQDLQ
jgi:hypothetical protein